MTKIAIFGTTPSRMEGPVQDDSGWERWTIGPGGKDAHNWERLYEMHGTWPADFRDYLNDLSLVKKPKQVVVLPQPNRDLLTWDEAIANWKREHNLKDDAIEGDWEAVRVFPRDAVIKAFIRRMWFSSSISWLIGEAMLMEDVTDIGLWGIDLESGEEYISQFAGCAHLLDLAQLRGINVHLPKNSGLLRDPAPYPDRYETNLALTLEKKANFLENAITGLEGEYESMKAGLHRQEGRFVTLQELGASADKIKEAEAELQKINVHLGQVACNLNQIKGENNATQFYRRMFVYNHTDPS